MSQSISITAADTMATYIEAKDRIDLQLLGRAFVGGDCEIEYSDKTQLVSLPNSSRGLQQITQFMASFGDQCENIRTFLLSRPNSDYLPHFRCDFLVGMNARQDGAVRVGCGRYDWHFANNSRLKKLGIVLEVMCVLPADQSKLILPLLSALPYPWCSYHQARESIPSMDALRPIAHFLKRTEENKPATV
jgi:hypothetical protein